MNEPEARSRKPVGMRRNAALIFLLATGSCLLAPLPGCTYSSSGPEPRTFRQKQEESLRDPINYKPDNENTQPYNISGGGVNNLDKDAMKKDLDNVFNP